MSSNPALASQPRSSASDLLRLARPRDWLKGVFVLMPLPFALASGAPLALGALALGIAAMSLTSSAVYALNDVMDADRDRANPRKRGRPVASGRISVRLALASALVWLCCGVLLALASGQPRAVVILALYVGQNLVYSLGAKHVPLVDVFLLSTGFVLRMVLGCFLLGVAPSNWLLLCSSALALLLALGKRHGELGQALGAEQRPALAGYNLVFLDQAMGIVGGVAVFGYALYCIETPLLVKGREFASLPFVVFGVLEYLRLAQVRGEGDSPVELLLRAPTLVVAGVGWVLASLWSVGLPRLWS